MKTIDLTEMCNLSADVCGQEPIHLSSAIQPHGALVGLDTKTLGLVTRSANVDTILGDAPLSEIPRWLPPQLVSACRDVGQSGEERTLIAEIPRIGSTEVHCFAGSGIVFCEFELLNVAAAEPFTLDGASLLVAQAIKDMKATKDLQQLADIAARSVRAVSGFERVIVSALNSMATERWSAKVWSRTGTSRSWGCGFQRAMSRLRRAPSIASPMRGGYRPRLRSVPLKPAENRPESHSISVSACIAASPPFTKLISKTLAPMEPCLYRFFATGRFGALSSATIASPTG